MDYTLCNNKHCEASKSCQRFIWWEEGCGDDRWQSMLVHEDQKHKCEIFLERKDSKK